MRRRQHWRAFDVGSLIVCELVYAELAPQFESREALDSALSLLDIRIIESGPDVAWPAGRKWADYRTAGGTEKDCWRIS